MPAALPAVVAGKKSNTSVTLATQETTNIAAQDNAIAVAAPSAETVIFQPTDQGAIEAARDIGGAAYDFAADANRTSSDLAKTALDSVRDLATTTTETLAGLVDKAGQSAGDAIKAALGTANIRSQVPAETIASDGGATVRVGIIAAAALAVAALVFRGGR